MLKNIEMVIQKKDGSKYDISNILENLTSNGDIKQAGRKCEFSTIRSKFNTELGDIAKFYDNKLEVFRGTVLSVSKNSSSDTISYTAIDEGWRLAHSKGTFKFENKTADEIAKEVLGSNKFTYGELAKGKVKMSKVFVNKSFYDIIMTAYTEEAKSSGKKYMIAVTRQKVHVIEKGITVLKVSFEEGKNIIDSEHSIDAENIVNRVIITDSNGNKKDVKDKKELQELYGVIQEIAEMKEDKGLSNEDINNIFKDAEKKCSLKGLVTDGMCVTGNAVMVKDSGSGLTGKFYIDSDTHTYSNGTHEVDLVLNFENIMDEKAEDGKEENEEGTSEGGVLNGKKVKALFTAYCPKEEGRIGGGPVAANGERIDYSKKTCAAPKSVPFNTNIQIVGTGTGRDGQTYRVNDRGGAINIVNGVYHFDLLMNSKKECDAWGKKYGEAIIGDGTGYSSGGGNSRAVTLAKSQLGKPYKWGATGPSSFDCSGLIYWVARQMGKSIPRTSREQSNYGQSVSKNALQPGDCVFFANKNGVHHVGMYVGNGEFIHAPKSNDVVRISKLSSRGDYHNARRFL